jgi:hypothetical protein
MIMGSHLTQPEEVELAMRGMETEKRDASAEKQAGNARLPTRNAEKSWNAGHISAYRAAYFKTHGLDM